MSGESFHFFAGDCCGEIAPSGQGIEEFFGCQDLAAAIYFTELFNARGRVCVVHDDDIDPESGAQVDDDDLSEAGTERLAAMRAIEWHESDAYAVASFDGPDGTLVTLEVCVEDDVTLGAVNGKRRLVAKDFQQAKARLAAFAYPMAEVPA